MDTDPGLIQDLLPPDVVCQRCSLFTNLPAPLLSGLQNKVWRRVVDCKDILPPMLPSLRFMAIFQSLCKRGLGSNLVMVLPPQNRILYRFLHRSFSLSCPAASKDGSAQASTSQNCCEDTRSRVKRSVQGWD